MRKRQIGSSHYTKKEITEFFFYLSKSFVDYLLNHLAATGRGAGDRQTRGGGGAKFGVLDSALGTGLNGRSARFGGWLFGFWIKNPSWLRGMNWFFNYSALLFFG